MVNMLREKSSVVNWSELCPDLLVLISKKIVDVLDFVYFRATCRGWRSATIVVDNTSQIPWIYRRRSSFQRSLFFYTFSSMRYVEIKCTKRFADKEIYGVSHWQGYILTYNDASSIIMSLINPLTNREISLPVIPGLEYLNCRLLGIELDKNGVPKFVAIQANHVSRSSTSICFCHIGDEAWTVVYDGYYRNLSDCNYYKWKLFLFCNLKSEIQVYDARTKSLVVHKILVPPSLSNNDSCFNFCVGEGGLLIITSTSCPTFCNIYFEVYRLENKNENPKWIKTTNIGDQILYFTRYDCQISKADNLSVFRRNCIYYICPDHRTYCSYLRMFDIEKGTIENMKCPTDGFGWFVPSLI